MSKTLGDYSLLRLIGSGGMSSVYLAVQNSTKKQVALKILEHKGDNSDTAVKRFLKEAKILHNIHHKNIVQLLEAGFDDGKYYITMEYIDGENLRNLIKNTQLSLPEKLSIFLQICQGLSALHKKNIIHRDIKPSNILINKKLHAYLTDFGISKQLETTLTNDTLTNEDSLIGTPQYMSPEQIVNPKLVNQQSDVYSLGILFFELLHDGFNPFFDSNKITCIKNQLDSPVPIPSDDYAIFAPIFDKCLAKKPEDRFESVSELYEELKHILSALKPFKKKKPAYIPQNLKPLLHIIRKYRFAIMGVLLLLIFGLQFYGKDYETIQLEKIKKDISFATITKVSDLLEATSSRPDKITLQLLKELSKQFLKSNDIYGYIDAYLEILARINDTDELLAFLSGNDEFLLKIPYTEFSNLYNFAEKSDNPLEKKIVILNHLTSLKQLKLIGSTIECYDCKKPLVVAAKKASWQEYEVYLLATNNPIETITTSPSSYISNLSYVEISKYLGWLSSELGREVRLPTYNEWAKFACLDCKTLSNPNEYGIYDAYGTLWEMTCSSPSSLESCTSPTSNKIILGGSFATNINKNTALISRISTIDRFDDVGFRVVID